MDNRENEAVDVEELSADDIVDAAGGKRSVDMNDHSIFWTCPDCGTILKGSGVFAEMRINAHKMTHGGYLHTSR